jgi:hypothetical protein
MAKVKSKAVVAGGVRKKASLVKTNSKKKIAKNVKKEVTAIKSELLPKKKKGPKVKKARPFEKLMVFLLTGQPTSKEDIAENLGWKAPRGAKVKGPKIYNVSSYIWDIKNIPHNDGKSIVVKSLRDGKKVTGYQIMNPEDARKYLEKRGLLEKKVDAPAVSASTPEESNLVFAQPELAESTK